jgi:hypothetical protein
MSAAFGGGFNWSAQHANLLARWSVGHETTTSHLLFISETEFSLGLVRTQLLRTSKM